MERDKARGAATSLVRPGDQLPVPSLLSTTPVKSAAPRSATASYRRSLSFLTVALAAEHLIAPGGVGHYLAEGGA